MLGKLDGDSIQQLVIGLTVVAALVLVSVYLLGKIRAKSAQQEPGVSELLTKFRELHEQGELSDAEFRTIKTTLAAKFQAELNKNNETG